MGKKISEYTNGGALQSTDKFIIARSGQNYYLLGSVMGSVSDAAFGAGWNGVVDIAPSKNAVYDQMILLALITNGSLTNPTITNYVETLYAPAAGSAWTVDLANGTVQKLTTNANATITLPASTAGKSYTIIVAYGGTHTITWAGGGTLKWAGGSAPVATSVNAHFDIYVFTCDGTNTFGADGGRNY